MAKDEIKNPLDDVNEESQTNEMEGDPRFDPNASDILRQQINPTFTQTVPTFTPTGNGERRDVLDNGSYFKYAFIDGVWRTLKYDGVQEITAGNNITISGTTNVTINAIPTEDIVEDYTGSDSGIAVDDVVSLIPGGSTEFWFQKHDNSFREIGNQANPNRGAAQFVAPLAMAGFDATVNLKMIGTTTDDINVILRSDSGGLPGSVLETEVIADTAITGSFADIKVTFAFTLVPGTTYWITVEKQGSLDVLNYYQAQVGNWRFYSLGATFDGASWTSDFLPLRLILEKTITAGLFRAIDVPNNVDMQGNIKGFVKAINGSTISVVVNGTFTDSGAPYTANQSVFLSSSTAGGVSTTGGCHLGQAQSTSKIDVVSHKKCILRFQASNLFTLASTPDTIFVMTGFQVRTIRASGLGDTFTSIGTLAVGDGESIKWRSSTAPARSAALWDTDNSGVGSSGSRTNGVTINSSSIDIAVISTAAIKEFSGTLELQN